jgi:putative transposase
MSEREGEIKMLKKLSRKTKDTRIRLRYDAVRLHLQDRTRTEIADILNTTYQTVTNYINAYNKSGTDGLKIKKSTGRRKKLTDNQEEQLYECITTRLPKDVGFGPFVNWTAPLACQWVKATFEVEFTERGMRDVFYRLKLSYTRPTYVLKNADPQKQAAFREEFEILKKTD